MLSATDNYKSNLSAVNSCTQLCLYIVIDSSWVMQLAVNDFDHRQLARNTAAVYGWAKPACAAIWIWWVKLSPVCELNNSQLGQELISCLQLCAAAAQHIQQLSVIWPIGSLTEELISCLWLNTALLFWPWKAFEDLCQLFVIWTLDSWWRKSSAVYGLSQHNMYSKLLTLNRHLARLS